MNILAYLVTSMLLLTGGCLIFFGAKFSFKTRRNNNSITRIEIINLTVRIGLLSIILGFFSGLLIDLINGDTFPLGTLICMPATLILMLGVLGVSLFLSPISVDK